MERIYKEWDKALSNNDVEGLLSLYSSDATIESPLIPYLMECEHGVLKGHGEIRALIERVAEQKPPIRKFYRKGFLTDGKTLMFEYPRETSQGEQMDFVEVMEIDGGLIVNHRVYWGWRGFKVIQENAYHKKSP
ncbi:MAG: hypothetical protein SP4CHLAM17_12760 [Chlamydiales bacterium]|nr:hypothetical protein [Chlamydiales bacterium]